MHAIRQQPKSKQQLRYKTYHKTLVGHIATTDSLVRICTDLRSLCRRSQRASALQPHARRIRWPHAVHGFPRWIPLANFHWRLGETSHNAKTEQCPRGDRRRPAITRYECAALAHSSPSKLRTSAIISPQKRKLGTPCFKHPLRLCRLTSSSLSSLRHPLPPHLHVLVRVRALFCFSSLF